jgi:hypothetical protein
MRILNTAWLRCSYATRLGNVFIGLNLAIQIHVIFEHLFSKVSDMFLFCLKFSCDNFIWLFFFSLRILYNVCCGFSPIFTEFIIILFRIKVWLPINTRITVWSHTAYSNTSQSFYPSLALVRFYLRKQQRQRL